MRRAAGRGLSALGRGLTVPSGPRWRDWGSVLIWAGGAWLGLYLVFYFSGVGSPEVRTAVTDFAYMPLSAIGLATGIRVVLSRAVDRRTRRAWRFIAAAIGCQLLANGAWCWLEAIRHTNPYPSLADIGYLAFIPVLLAGLLTLPARRRSARELAKLGLDLVTVTAAGFMILWYLVLGPEAAAGGSNALATGVTLAYPVGDLVLMFGVAAALLRGTSLASRRSLQLLIAALAAFITADMYYGYLGLHSAFVGGSWPDLFWLTANYLFAASANAQRYWSGRIGSDVAGHTETRPVSRLPYLAVAFGYGLLLIIARGQHLYPLGGMVLGAVALTAAVVLRQLSVLHENRELAVTDNLTGLANRALIRDTLSRALARSKAGGVGVLLIDLDRFKEINDRYGHEAGDAVLVAVARSLRACSRAGDTPGRLGGDEFAIVLEDIEGAGTPAAVAGRVLRALEAPIPFGERHFVVGASVGAAVAESTGITPSDLLHRADVAMYAAKKSRTGGYALYRDGMGTKAAESELRAAMDRGEFVVHYQPILNLADGAVTGLEALVRWQHPTRGTVPPAEFIPAAEESGLIVELGRWVLADACRQMGEWQDRLPLGPDLTLAVNLSPVQVQHAGFVDDVTAVLAEAGFDPGRLVLELTEGALLPGDKSTVDKLEMLRGYGIRIAIDDFGSGFASLGYLNGFPVDVLKIDRSFTAGLGAPGRRSALSEAVVALGERLRLQTVAEGIETVEQLDTLRGLGCPYGQGFYFTQPLDAARTELLLAHSPLATPIAELPAAS
jgi:diguanylate cyclase